MALRATYNACGSGLFINGVPIIMAGEETIFRIDEIADNVKKIDGVGGEYTWVKNFLNSAVITIVLAAASPSNAFISALVGADALFGSGSFNISILIPGFNAITANDCRVQRQPDLEFGLSPGEREWKIIVPNMINLYLLPIIELEFPQSGVTLTT
jgi:hypothetical protein